MSTGLKYFSSSPSSSVSSSATSPASTANSSFDPKEFQREVDGLIKKLTIASFPLQKKCFKCCVNCFDIVAGGDVEAVGRCLQSCQQPADHFTQTLQREMNTLQSNIQACQEVCYNRFSDSFNEASNETARSSVESQMRGCTGSCFVQFKPHLKEIAQRMETHISKTTAAV